MTPFWRFAIIAVAVIAVMAGLGWYFGALDRFAGLVASRIQLEPSEVSKELVGKVVDERVNSRFETIDGHLATAATGLSEVKTATATVETELGEVKEGLEAVQVAIRPLTGLPALVAQAKADLGKQLATEFAQFESEWEGELSTLQNQLGEQATQLDALEAKINAPPPAASEPPPEPEVSTSPPPPAGGWTTEEGNCEMKSLIGAALAACIALATAPAIAADAYAPAPAQVVGIDCSLTPNACTPEPVPAQGCYLKVAILNYNGPAVRVDVEAWGSGNQHYDSTAANGGTPLMFGGGTHNVPIPCDVAQAATRMRVCLDRGPAEVMEQPWMASALQDGLVGGVINVRDDNLIWFKSG